VKTLYIFDMGGVVACDTDVFPEVFDHLKVTSEQFYAFAGESFEKLIEGKISADKFWADFSARCGRPVVEELFIKFFRPRLDQAVTAIIRQLKNDASVVCGTNTFDSHYDYLAQHGYYEIFDAVFASNKIGVSKPKPDFYRHILENMGANPEDTVFVDDVAVNVLAAEELGIESILFKDSHTLHDRIRRL
jgi:HAD superfamily hydrolase (TIGR01509 family)